MWSVKSLMLRAQHCSATRSAEVDVGRICLVQLKHSKFGESFCIRLHELRINIEEIHRFFQIFHLRRWLSVGSDVGALEAFGAAAAATKLRHGVRQSQLDLATVARNGRHLR